MPIGTILPYVGSLSKIPAGWHLCDGTNGTPDMRDRFLMGAGTKTVGNYITAGLPNIIARIPLDDGLWFPLNNNPLKYGAVKAKLESGFGNDLDGTGASLPYYAEIDASLASAIYGNSDTVQPPAYTVYFIMKIM